MGIVRLPIHPYNTFPGNRSNDFLEILQKSWETRNNEKCIQQAFFLIYIPHGLDRGPTARFACNLYIEPPALPEGTYDFI